ncbi:MAG: protein tyrosine phosphatase [Gaiellales bacterium]|nr:MAG: protein tyrosine phosphatase [Gaiellales bacterium]
MRSIWPIFLEDRVGFLPASKRSWQRKVLAVALAGLLSAPSSCWLYQQGRGNFHEVSAGQVYRSRQLNKKEMAYFVRRYHIRSILNLRGANQGADWYQDELSVARRLAVRHYDHGISANHDIDSHVIEHILSLLRDAPKPILIHCNFGADRTGLIAAAYLYAMEGRTFKEARQQLSVFYGHFPYLWSRTGAMDRSLLRYIRRQPRQQTPRV